MSPDEIKQLRKDLKLSARELATSIKAETEDVWAWETGERFPTKRFVTRMLTLRKTGGAKQPLAAAEKSATTKAPGLAEFAGMARLSDPELWTL
ncbi:MAG TPA: XRE family transcriptional regulator, partial [Polyangiaceae bacterium]